MSFRQTLRTYIQVSTLHWRLALANGVRAGLQGAAVGRRVFLPKLRAATLFFVVFEPTVPSFDTCV